MGLLSDINRSNKHEEGVERNTVKIDWVLLGDGRFSVLYNGIKVASILVRTPVIYVDMVYVSDESSVVATKLEVESFIQVYVDKWGA